MNYRNIITAFIAMVIASATIITPASGSKHYGVESSQPSVVSPAYIIEQLEKDKNLSKFTVGGFMMTLGSLFTDTHGVKSVVSYKLGECSVSTVSNYYKNIALIDDSRFDGVITTCEEGVFTKVLFIIKDEAVSEMYVMSSGEEEPVLVKITGSIKLSDLPSMMEERGMSYRE